MLSIEVAWHVPKTRKRRPHIFVESILL
jgi:hypothetical protein